MVTAINSEDYLNPQREKHRIKAKQLSLGTTSVQILLKKMKQIIQGALLWTISEQISLGIPSS